MTRSKTKRKICVVTTIRADYNLLYWLMREITSDSELQLQLIASGTHLSEKFGNTVKNIEADGFTIDRRIPLPLDDDSELGVVKASAVALRDFGAAFRELSPDVVVILGDRYEMFAAALAAFIQHFPIAHLYGGEVTEAAIDDSFRHAISKLAQLHFVSAEPYRQRVIQLGEPPERVFNFGAPGVDFIANCKLVDRKGLTQFLGGFDLGGICFLSTYHPVTLSADAPDMGIMELLTALDEFPDAKCVFTLPNADPRNDAIRKAILSYQKKHPTRICAHAALGGTYYLSLLSQVNLVVGNSSSGILEAPYFKKPSINIGDRQKGRIRADSVIDCPEERGAIALAIRKGLSAEFAKKISTMAPPFGAPGASKKIRDHLRDVELSSLMRKTFHNLTIRNR